MPRLLIIITLLLLTSHPYMSDAADETEHSEYITLVNEKGEVILQTGLNISLGDRYIDEDNSVYEIIHLEGNVAKARYVRNDLGFEADNEAVPAQASQANRNPAKIAIYHTHTDESYIPSDGKPTEPGNGSIMRVGEIFASRLKELGYNPIHDKTIHDPHDANAYHRSRRTFTKLLTEEQPVALFDIHRDSAPLSIYKATINGQDTSRLLLVVGRQNQNQATTLNYARQLKQQADNRYKGLVRGIFIAHGNYNQDLSPQAILVEVGTQYNTLQAAERGIALFADIIPSLIAPQRVSTTYAPDSNVQAPSNNLPAAETSSEYNTKNYLKDIFYILATITIGATAYLYLSTGSWREAKAKLKRFRKYEFTNFFGPRKKH